MKNCFVIMPFSGTSKEHTEDYWNKMFKVIKEIMSSLDYVCKRSMAVPSNLVRNIILNLKSSDIVVAILTDMNPNVWYELGIRHSLKKGTIMLLQKGQKLPFDISNYGVIQYEEGIDFHSYLQNEICNFLKSFRDTTNNDSPVFDALPMHQKNEHLDKSSKHLSNMHDDIRKAKNISILFNTGKSFLGTYREDLTTAIRDNACILKILIASKSNIAFRNQGQSHETTEEIAFRESLCWGTKIKEEIEETIGIVATIIDDLKNYDNITGSVTLKTYFAVQTGSIVIVDEKVKYTPYLPTVHSRDSISFFANLKNDSEAIRFQETFDRIWNNKRNCIDKIELSYPTIPTEKFDE